MNTKKKFKLSFFALAVGILIFLALVAVATAFIGPTQDPSTAGFRSPCGFALSKDDNCTFDRALDSLEAVSDKIGTLTPG